VLGGSLAQRPADQPPGIAAGAVRVAREQVGFGFGGDHGQQRQVTPVYARGRSRETGDHVPSMPAPSGRRACVKPMMALSITMASPVAMKPRHPIWRQRDAYDLTSCDER
jgi:hypothetical protein